MLSLRSRSVSSAAVLLAAGAFTFGCTDTKRRTTFVEDPERGRFDVWVTDAPPQLDRLRQVNVFFERVDAIGFVDTATEATTIDVPFILAPEDTPTQVDLLPLRGGQRQLVGSGNVPRGTYQTFRVYFSEVEVIYNTTFGDETFSTGNGRLTVSGAEQEGELYVFELTAPDGAVMIEPGQVVPLLVDVDLFESLDVTGDATAPTAMTFTPTARLRRLDGPTGTGSISGQVRSDRGTPTEFGDDAPVENAIIQLQRQADEEIVASTKTDGAGVYVIEGLAPGAYTMIVSAEGVTAQELQVNVNEGQRTTQDVVLAETPTEPTEPTEPTDPNGTPNNGAQQ
ncbi:MAG: DUF4382 domain-containing protein [Planctomycetes bacterium]|nr:DUF4382 domain-containing protein [Planctomycetota bacterium]